jgi:hypothetical protein
VIRDNVSKLSERDTCILKWLLPFLNDVATHSKGMTLESLAICFAPSLFEPMHVSMENPLKSIQDQKRYMKIAAHMLCLLVRHENLSRKPPPPPTLPPRNLETSKWKCVYRGVRCRSNPELPTKSILSAPYVVREGDVVVALEHRIRSGWIRIVIRDREVWVPLRHEKYGALFLKMSETAPSPPTSRVSSSLPTRSSSKIVTPKLPPRNSLRIETRSAGRTKSSTSSNLTTTMRNV